MQNANAYAKPMRGGGRTFTAERQRAEIRYVADLIEVLRPRPAGLRRWAIMQAIRRIRAKGGVEIPHRFEDDVEDAFQQYCADSDAYKKGAVPAKPALFSWPMGKDGGIWALNADKADAWLQAQSQQASDDLFDSRTMASRPDRTE